MRLCSVLAERVLTGCPFPYTTLFRSDPGERPVDRGGRRAERGAPGAQILLHPADRVVAERLDHHPVVVVRPDRKSTRLNSSHGYISYAVCCLKKTTELHSNSPLLS